MVTAKLIGESSAGLTAVEIHRNDQLVWSHNYFSGGCSTKEYILGLTQAVQDMLDCEDFSQFEGCDIDDDGYISRYSNDDDDVMLSYSKGQWSVGNRELGQSDEIVEALIRAKIVSGTPDHEKYSSDLQVLNALVTHLGNN